MTEMLERAARVLFEHTLGPGRWEDASARSREVSYERARAVLVEIREQTRDMAIAGERNSTLGGRFDAGMVWRAMIDAALDQSGSK